MFLSDVLIHYYYYCIVSRALTRFFKISKHSFFPQKLTSLYTFRVNLDSRKMACEWKGHKTQSHNTQCHNTQCQNTPCDIIPNVKTPLVT